MVYENKKVLIRVEYNVPIDKKGNITDNSRIKSSVSTLKKILKEKPKQIIIITHFGRPKNKEKIYQTDNLAKELEHLLKKKVVKVNHCGEEKLPDDKIIMLENLRFYSGEKKGDKKFSEKLSELADLYVNESFGTCHRKDASMYTVPSFFNKKRVFLGENVKLEVNKLSEVLNSKDLDLIIGFAKISDKINIVKKLIKKSKRVFIGGKVVFAFMKAENLNIGKVLVSEEDINIAKEILSKYGKKIILPVDFKGEINGKIETAEIDKIKKSFIGYDLGPKTVILWKELLQNSKLIFWNGPLGYFEKKPFDNSTNEIAEFISKNNVKTIVGGGDTALAIKKTGYSKDFYHISTGGGASLEFIEKNGKLPALKFFNNVK